ncbi:MAG: hypothetical protein A3F13_01845 [Gammaproteobacteria bacterium RIFCSPHIGHO2_12_FULL_40_19]|nr:MAG: hypothetical protein A3F13_01845 [Gammaproteobacteria bacterium RIFCSPHIGHO2_12_FULL_40_19]
MPRSTTDSASIEITQENAVLLKGKWLIGNLTAVEKWIQKSLPNQSKIQTIDASHIKNMDTAGAFLLYKIQQKLNGNVKLDGLSEHFQDLFSAVISSIESMQKKPAEISQHNWFYHVGKATVELIKDSLEFFAFLGETFIDFLEIIKKPAKLQFRSMVHEIDVGGYRALPIIAVMMLLIGVVVAYQLGVQLRIYGANVYMVDLSGVAILREFSPLICSVIIAGRTSTSFAALLGTMKVNEEIDALKTMGLSPIERLVIPKIFGLLIALPLLVVWGDIFGVFGSMIMAKSMISVGFHAFLERFRQEVAIKHLYIGLVKTPVFALIIAGIGCYQGFQASGSAESVGERTTKAAVQAIFLIILADGIFSILFNWLDI